MLRILVLDPGLTSGLLVCLQGPPPRIRMDIATSKVSLPALPGVLYRELEALAQTALPGDETLLFHETFNLRAGKARQQAGSVMPSSEGIGVLRGVAHALGFAPPIGLAPGVKEAGKAFAARELPAVADARAACKNDHERDVCDLLGYVLRQRALNKGFC